MLMKRVSWQFYKQAKKTVPEIVFVSDMKLMYDPIKITADQLFCKVHFQ